MRNARIVVFCILSAIAVPLILLYGSESFEPVFKGRTATEYIYYGTRDECCDAMRHLGTNALPCIGRALRVQNTVDRRALSWLAMHQSMVKIRVSSSEDIHVSALFAYKDILYLVWKRRLPDSVADTCASEIGVLAKETRLAESAMAVDVLKEIEWVKNHMESAYLKDR